jgi:hypothetical protein
MTSIGRPVDPRYPTNRAILIVMGIALAAAATIAAATGHGVVACTLSGVHAALLVFLVWAYGRETAPDDNPAAFVGVALVSVAWGFGVRPDLLSVAALMGASRVVNRTVGPKPRLTDLAATVAIAGWVTWHGDWPVGLAAAMALLLDFRLKPRNLVAMPFAAALAAITVMTWRHTPPIYTAPTSTLAWIAVGIAGAFALVMLGQGALRSRTDLGDEPLHPARVQGGMAVALVAAAGTIGRGDAYILAAAGLWAVLAGTVVGRPRLWLRSDEQQGGNAAPPPSAGD